MLRRPVFLLLLFFLLYSSSLFAAQSRLFRPYAGVGVLFVAHQSDIPLYLYDETSRVRQGEFRQMPAPGYTRFLGSYSSATPLLVMEQKNDWFRVVFDESGREAWVKPRGVDHWAPWQHMLAGRCIRLLTGLKPVYYKARPIAGKGTLALSAEHVLRVVMVEKEWILVVTGPDRLAWVRWCDEDGRLLISLAETEIY